MKLPIFNELEKSKSVLLIGAGGGFDIVSGLPLYLYLRDMGIDVTLANLSFTELTFSESKEVFEGTYSVTKDSLDLPYFPEKYLQNWLLSRNETPFIYALSNKMGVQPLRQAYTYLVDQHNIDTLILVDGGTDSLMFGDEQKVGTIVEDACSIIAASKVNVTRNYLTAIGFGVEHNLNHHACLENISTLTKQGDHLGALSVTGDMPEGKAFLELVEYLNDAMPLHSSIVTNSIASAINGEFGDHHSTWRTKGSIQFVSALMNMLWFFQTNGVASQIRFGPDIEDSTSMHDVANAFQLYRLKNKPRVNQSIPLR